MKEKNYHRESLQEQTIIKNPYKNKSLQRIKE